MKRMLLAAMAVLVSISASAAMGVADIDSLKAYATKAVALCPNSSVMLDPITGGGPANFLTYRVTLKTPDETCARQTYLLYSPATQQTIVGSVIALPEAPGSLEQRLSARATELLKTPITATISKFPLPDGLKLASMTKQTEWGPFSYRAVIDQSESFMIVGMRGNLRVDPAKTLVESLVTDSAVRRGNKAAKISIIELSDFQCPTCGRAHKNVEPIIAKNLSKVNYTRLDLPLFEHHEWAVPAALGAHAIQKVAPAKYWSYVDFIFKMQDAITLASFDKVLRDFCSDNDIDWKAVEKVYKSQGERTAIMEGVSRAFDAGILSTPTYIVNGRLIGFGPSGSFTIETIKKALGAK